MQADNVGVTGTTKITFDGTDAEKVGPGMNKVAVVSAFWTDTADIDITFRDISGHNPLAPDVVPIDMLLDDGVGTDPGLAPVVSDSVAYQNTLLRSAIWVIPLDDVTPDNRPDLDNAYNAMSREYEVTFTGGTSTDVYLRADVFNNVSQSSPVFDASTLNYTADDGTGSIASSGEGIADGSDSILTGLNMPTAPSNDELMLDIMGALQLLSSPATLQADTPGGQEQLSKDEDWGNPLGSVTNFDAGSSIEPVANAGSNFVKWEGNGNTYVATSHSALTLESCGTSCTVTLYDFGDAHAQPELGLTGDTYTTLLASGGPHHAPKGPTIGGGRDAEPDAAPPGNFDDYIGSPDDEDGLEDGGTNGNSIFDTDDKIPTFISHKSNDMGINTGFIELEIRGLALDETGYITVYVDWDLDGTFTGANEQVVAGAPVVGDGSGDQEIILSFEIPVTSDMADTSKDIDGENIVSAMRVRLHTDPMGTGKVLPIGGHASDGEVEDHPIELLHGAEIHGLKFEDMDGDGNYEPSDGDTPMSGVVFQLQQETAPNVWEPAEDAAGMVIPNQVSTGASAHNFWFDTLNAGTYRVVELLTETNTNGDKSNDTAIVDGKNGVFDAGASGKFAIDQGLRNSSPGTLLPDGNPFLEVTLETGECVDDIEFGNFVTGSIHGYKFEDLNANGIKDGDDAGLGGINFHIWEFLGSKTSVTSSGSTTVEYNWTKVATSATTDSHGEFWFTHIDPGTYTVVENATTNDPWILSTGQLSSPPTSETNPASVDTFVIRSGVEYSWEAGAFSRPMDLNSSNTIEQFEIDYAKAQVALKEETVRDDGSLFFGNYEPGSIHGFKYEDKNRDGKFVAVDDAPLADVTMRLEGTDGMGGTVDRTTLTMADGMFWFDNVTPGSYTVTELADDVVLPGDTPDHKGTDTNKDGVLDKDQDMVLDSFAESLTVLSGESKTLTHQWANFIYGSIHGVKFEDSNANGVWDDMDKDDGEKPLSGIEFDLFRFAGKTTQITASGSSIVNFNWVDVGDGTSNSHGEFWFTQLNPGTYEVVERDSSPWIQSTNQPTGTPDHDPATSKTALVVTSGIEYVWELGAASRAIDGMDFVGDTDLSDADGFINGTEGAAGTNSGALKTEVLAADPSGQNLQFGNFKNGSIHGFKYEDVNRDNKFVAGDGDVPLANVTMRLEGTDGMGGIVDRTMLTMADGMFWFENVKPGVYSVTELADNVVLPGDTPDHKGTDTNKDGVLDKEQDMVLDGFSESVTVTSGETENLTHQWANYIYGSIHGIKFEDSNANGVWDDKGEEDGEKALSGVNFDLYKFTGKTTKITASGKTITTYMWQDVNDAVSNSHGEFWFTQLDPGIYEVVENPSGTMVLTTGQLSEPPTGDPAASSTAFEIESRIEYVWEAGAASRAVDGMDFVGDTDLSDANGFIDGTEAQAGINAGALKTEIVASPTEGTQDLWYGNLIKGSIHGFKYEDVNRDGKFVPADGDVPLENATMVLVGTDGVGGTVSRTTLTMADGWFWFESVTPGTYTVAESPSTDTNVDDVADNLQDMVLDPTTVNVELSSGETITFGVTEGYTHQWANYVYGSIHGVKFEDTNANGVWDDMDKDDGEKPLAGIEFDLYLFKGSTSKIEASGTEITTFMWEDVGDATSNSHGEFWFTQLNPGIYEVVEADNNPWIQSTGQPTDAPDHDPTTSPTAFEIESRIEYVWEKGAASRAIDGMDFVGDTDLSNADGFLDSSEQAAGTNSGALKTERLADASQIMETLTFSSFSFDRQAIIDVTEGSYNITAAGLSGTDGHPALKDVSGNFVIDTDGGEEGSLVFKRTDGMPFTFDSFQYALQEAPVGPGPHGEPIEFRGFLGTSSAPVFTISGTPSSDSFETVTGSSLEIDRLELHVTGSESIDTLIDNLKFTKNITQDLRFGDFKNGSIHGFKYEDFNKDGKFDAADDEPLANVTMRLEGTDGMGGTVDRTVLTMSDGMFWFEDVKPGSYTVTELADNVVLPGDIPDHKGTDTNKDGVLDKDQDMVLDGFAESVTITSGETENLTHQWANFVYGSIHGVKFEDANANGLWDNRGAEDGEKPLPGIEFTLYKFTGQTTKVTASGNSTVTYMWQDVGDATSNSHGEFWFTQLDPGVYEVVEDISAPWIQSTGQPTDAPTGNPATSPTAFEIESRIEYVWEKGAASRAIDGMDFVGDTDLSDANGFLDGTEPAAGKNSGALKTEIVASPTEGSQDLWFGNFQNGSIHGFKYEDVNRDGTYVPADGDVPLANVTMRLAGNDGMGGVVDRTVLTMSDGMFWFENVKPGSYSVSELADNVVLPGDTPDHKGTDTNKDGVLDKDQDMALDSTTVPVTLTSGETENLTYQFANYVFGSIHGVKFHDIDADGVWEADESRLEDITFELFKFEGTTQVVFSGNVVTTYLWDDVDEATTDEHGEFWFTQLDPGIYEVIEQDNTPWVQSTGQPTMAPIWDPATSTSAFEIVSRREFVWEPGAASRPMDSDGNEMIDAAEIQAGINAGILKNEVIANPALLMETITFTGFEFDRQADIDVTEGSYSITAEDLIGGTDGHPALKEISGNFVIDTDGGEEGPLVIKRTDGMRFTFDSFQFALQEAGVGPGPHGESIEFRGFLGTSTSPVLTISGTPSSATLETVTGSSVEIDRLELHVTSSVSIDTLIDNLKFTKVSQDLRYGNYKPGSLHGFKYEDVNRDGKYVPADGDVPLANATMALVGTDFAGGTVSRSTLTMADGMFWFDNVKPGNYTVSESVTTDTNMDGVWDSMQDMVLDSTAVAVSLTSGESVIFGVTEDFTHQWANFVYGSIHGVKFEDANANGVWDDRGDEDGEKPLSGINFDLYKFSGQTTKITASGKVSTTYMWQDVGDATSNSHGEFWFTQLNPGTYEVVERDNSPWILSTGQLTDAPTHNPATSPTAFEIESRIEYVWELGAASRAIDGMSSVGDTDLSDANGFIDGTEPAAGKNSGALKTEVLATPTDGTQDLWFGNFKNGSIHGFKYEDVNKDGKFVAADDVPLANVTMRMEGTDGMGGAVDRTTLTMADGMFWFENVKPGSYTVSELADNVVLPGDTPDHKGTDTNKDGVLDKDQDMVLDGFTEAVTVTSDATKNLTHQWANYVYGSIHGVKFEDTNANGIWDDMDKDDGEKPLSDIHFDLYQFKGSTTKLEASGKEITTFMWEDVGDATSDSHGEFWFTQLDPGFYEVVEQNNSPWIQSTGQPTEPPTGNPASSPTAIEIESRIEYVWQKGAASRPIDGMDFVGDTDLSDANGFIDGTEAAAGTNSGALKTEKLATPSSTDGTEDLWFGNFKNGSIHGFKYEDVNKDGKFVAADDEPLANVTMRLEGTDGMGGTVDRTTLTMADGMFWFESVKPGSYTVTELADNVVLPGDLPDHKGTDTNKDGVLDKDQDMVLDGFTESVTLTSGETENLTHQWANFIYGSIHGVKFEDTNANGLWDSSESPLADIAFDLYKFTGQTTKITASGKSTTTYMWQNFGDASSDAHGEFWFTQLDPGIYEVIEDPSVTLVQSTGQPKLPEGKLTPDWNPATSPSAFEIESRIEYVWEKGAASRAIDGMDFVGDNDLSDADGFINGTEPAAGKNSGALKTEVVASPTEGSQDLWFGNFEGGAIHGFKYEDVNRDGKYVPDDGDLPLANATMELSGTDLTGGAVSRTTLTMADGMFWFQNVTPGDYTISESTATDTNDDDVPDNQQDMVLDDTEIEVVLGSGEVVTFGVTEGFDYQWANYVYGSIHGVKFGDINANGIWDDMDKDDGEKPLSGINFDLYLFKGATTKLEASGTEVTTFMWEDVGDATSDSHGEFWFTQLDPGIYEVVEQDNSPWIQSTGQPTAAPTWDPASSDSAFEISSRIEYVWQKGAASRPIDGMDFVGDTDLSNADGFIDSDEAAAGKNSGALKTEKLATPSSTDGTEDLWYGNFKNGSIHGFKYEDVNKDGKFVAADDEPLANVTMRLEGTDGMGGTVDRTVLTMADGMFWFENVKPGSYSVTELADNVVLPGDIPDHKGTDTNKDGVLDKDQDMVLDGFAESVTITSGETENLTHQWANFIYGSIHGVKFQDSNANGVWDNRGAEDGEKPLAGIEFTLYKFTGQTTKVTASGNSTVTYMWQDVGDATSNSHGEFWFTQLDPGVYEVVEDVTAPWIQSTGQPTAVPTGNPATSQTAFEIESRIEYVWEKGAASRPIDGMDFVGDTDLSDANGFLDGTEPAAGKNSGALKTEVVASPTDGSQDLWFGNFQNGDIHGFKYEDVNRDGKYVMADGDVPLANVTMRLEGTDGMGGTVDRTVLTMSDGMFWFENVKPGGYTVTELADNVVLPGDTPDHKGTDTNKDGVLDKDQDMALDPTTVPVTLTSGETENLTYQFANYVFGSIHGVKFEDSNANGIWDSGEDRLEGITFELFKFEGTTTQLISSGKTVTTFLWDDVDESTSDSHGEFWFTQLDPGIYEIVEQDNSPWVQSTPQPTDPPDHNPATSKTAFEIVSRREFVWEPGAASRPMDTDGSGTIDPAEQTAGKNAGILKNEVIANPALLMETVTFTGFEFDRQADIDVTEGSYNITAEDLIGGTDGHPALKDISGNFVIDTDGGEEGPLVFKRTDGMRFTFDSFQFALQDVPTGPGPHGESIEFRGFLGTSTSPVLTISGTPSSATLETVTGSSVEIDRLELHVTSSVSIDTLIDNLKFTKVSQDLRYGNFRPGSIHGFKYEDVNHDGKFVPADGDVPLADVTMRLEGTDGMGGTVDRTTLSMADGMFWFQDVKPGSYTVSELFDNVVLPGDTPDHKGTDTNKDGVLDKDQDMVLDGFTESTTVASGETKDLTHQWANFVYGSIHGVKFEDLNADGLWDMEDEDPLENIGFDLYKFTGKSTSISASGKVTTNYLWQDVRDATSNSHGEFWFTQLDPGFYEVVEQNNNPWIQSTSQPTKAPTHDPATSPTAYVIESRIEYVWELGAASRPIDGMDFVGDTDLSNANGLIDGMEPAAGKNSGALKTEVLATPTEGTQDLWFGNFKNGSIHGFKYEDVNKDGKFVAADDEPLANVTMRLEGTDGMGSTVDRTTLTMADGMFWFEDVKPGSYSVSELADNVVLPGDLPDHKGTDTNKDGILDKNQDMVLDGFTESVSVTSGDTKDLTHQWANYIYGSIHGVKFYDFGNDGKWDNDDYALANVTFDLYKFDKAQVTPLASGATKTEYLWDLVDSSTTESHGEFWFTQLDPGLYEVRERASSLVQTTSQPIGAPGTDFAPNSTASTFEIVSRREYVWELGAESREIDGMTQDADGNFIMQDPDGVIDDGEIAAAKNAGALKVPVEANQSKGDQDLVFGDFYPDSKVHIFKFHDVNGNTVWDQGSTYAGEDEPALSEVKVYLMNGDTIVGTDITNENGEAWFDIVWDPKAGLVPSGGVSPATMFTLSEDEDGDGDGRVDFSDINGDGINDSPNVHWSTLGGSFAVDAGKALDWKGADGQPGGQDNNTDLMVGNFITGSVHGFKFADMDADGVYDPPGTLWHPHPDLPFEWAKFELLDADGNSAKNAFGQTIGVVDTGVDGQFWFEDLAPGTYTVTERLDLIDRNDANKDGFPDVIDADNDGFPETNGNGNPDINEGLAASTPSSYTLTILSGQEFVWKAGEAMLQGTTVTIDDGTSVPSGLSLTNTGGSAVGFTDPGASFTSNTSTDVFSHGAGDVVWSSTNALNAAFTGGKVTKVSVDVYGTTSGTDIATLRAFDKDNNEIAADTSGVLDITGAIGSPSETLTVSGDDIAYVLVSGNVLGNGIGIDNLVYDVASLKTEVAPDGSVPVEGELHEELLFGNYYAGSVHGFKYQQGNNTPDGTPATPPVGAPGIRIDLLQNGKLVDFTITDEKGEYWFTDVKPGTYTVAESDLTASAVLSMALPRNVMVDYGQTVVADLSQLAPTGMAELTGPWPENVQQGIEQLQVEPSLIMINKIAGSIHGVKYHEGTTDPIPGMKFRLIGASSVTMGTATTDSDGEFWFENLEPGEYIVEELQTGAVVKLANPVPITVHSGEEVVAFDGQSDGHLEPGQYETVDDHLELENLLFGSIQGKLVGENGQALSGVLVTLSGDANALATTNETGDYSFENLIPGVYDILIVTHNTSIEDVLVSSGEEEVANIGMSSLSPGQYETVNNALHSVIDLSLPQVVDVKLTSTGWTSAYLNAVDPQNGLGWSISDIADPNWSQMTPWSWANVDQIVVQFSEAVQGSGPGGALTTADIAVTGVNQASYPINSIDWDAASNRATLNMGTVLWNDKYRLVINADTVGDANGNSLDGEWTDDTSSYPSGDGVAGTSFDFRFNILPGNYDLDQGSSAGAINFVDFSVLGFAYNSSIGDANYLWYADANGDGEVDFIDFSALGAFYNQLLPAGTPASSPFSPLLAPSFAASSAPTAVDQLFAEDDDELYDRSIVDKQDKQDKQDEQDDLLVDPLDDVLDDIV